MALTRGTDRSRIAAQSINQVLQSIGKQEQLRRERQQINNIAQLVSRKREEGRDATTQEILGVLDQPAETAGGFQGFLQTLGGKFQPQPGRIGTEIRSGIVSDALERALTPAGSTETPEGLELSGARTDAAGRITGRTFARPTGDKKTLSGERLKQIDKQIASGKLIEGSDKHLKLLGASGNNVKTPEDKLQFWQTVLQKTIDAIGTPLEGQEGTAKLAGQKIQEAKDELEAGPELGFGKDDIAKASKKSISKLKKETRTGTPRQRSKAFNDLNIATPGISLVGMLRSDKKTVSEALQSIIDGESVESVASRIRSETLDPDISDKYLDALREEVAGLSVEELLQMEGEI